MKNRSPQRPKELSTLNTSQGKHSDMQFLKHEIKKAAYSEKCFPVSFSGIPYQGGIYVSRTATD